MGGALYKCMAFPAHSLDDAMHAQSPSYCVITHHNEECKTGCASLNNDGLHYFAMQASLVRGLAIANRLFSIIYLPLLQSESANRPAAATRTLGTARAFELRSHDSSRPTQCP